MGTALLHLCIKPFDRTSRYSRIALDKHSGGNRFESRPGQHFHEFFRATPQSLQANAKVVPVLGQYLSWFPIRHSSVINPFDDAISLSFFPVAPNLEHRTSVKRFVSLQFLNPKNVGRIPWTGISPSQGRYLHRTAQTQNKHRHPCHHWDSNPRSQCSSERRQFMP
jgi:hypothetical protein